MDPATPSLVDVRHRTGPQGLRVAEVVLQRAARRNALSPALIDAATAAFDTLAADATVQAVLLRGDGPVFVAGADLPTMASLHDEAAARAFITRLHGLCAAVRRCPVPVIAVIRGAAIGAGMELAAACDLRISSDSARYGMPEVLLGLPSVIEAALLPRLIGWGRAAELVLLGQTVTAAEVASWGFLNDCVPEAELEAAVERRLHALAQCDAHAVRLQKELLRRWETAPSVGDAAALSVPIFGRAFGPDGRAPALLAARVRP